MSFNTINKNTLNCNNNNYYFNNNNNNKADSSHNGDENKNIFEKRLTLDKFDELRQYFNNKYLKKKID